MRILILRPTTAVRGSGWMEECGRRLLDLTACSGLWWSLERPIFFDTQVWGRGQKAPVRQLPAPAFRPEGRGRYLYGRIQLPFELFIRFFKPLMPWYYNFHTTHRGRHSVSPGDIVSYLSSNIYLCSEDEKPISFFTLWRTRMIREPLSHPVRFIPSGLPCLSCPECRHLVAWITNGPPFSFYPH